MTAPVTVAHSSTIATFRLVHPSRTKATLAPALVATTEIRLAPTATFIGICAKRTSAGTMKTPPPRPEIAPMNPALIESANRLIRISSNHRLRLRALRTIVVCFGNKKDKRGKSKPRLYGTGVENFKRAAGTVAQTALDVVGDFAHGADWLGRAPDGTADDDVVGACANRVGGGEGLRGRAREFAQPHARGHDDEAASA